MKLLIIIFNIFLTVVTVWCLHGVFSGGETVTYTAGSNRDRNPAAAEAGENESRQQELSSEEAANSLLHNDVFALSRCPSLENNAQTLTLTGIIITESTCGAVITQNTANRGGPRPGMQQNNRRAQNTSASNQRYFRVGEKINDQYTLAAVSRNSVTLTGPTGTRVLELQKSSDISRSNQNRDRGWNRFPGMMGPRMMGPGMMPQWMMNPAMMGGWGGMPMQNMNNRGGWNRGGANRGGWNRGGRQRQR